MKITKRQLRQIIKEEKRKLLNESAPPGHDQFTGLADLSDHLELEEDPSGNMGWVYLERLFPAQTAALMTGPLPPDISDDSSPFMITWSLIEEYEAESGARNYSWQRVSRWFDEGDNEDDY